MKGTPIRFKPGIIPTANSIKNDTTLIVNEINTSFLKSTIIILYKGFKYHYGFYFIETDRDFSEKYKY